MWLFACAGIAALAGFVALAAALYLYAAEVTSPRWAAVITGLAAMLVAATFLVWARSLKGRPRERRPARDDEAMRPIDAAIQQVLRAEKLTASDLMITGLLAGIVLGAGSGSRRDNARKGREHG
jgi:small-conductance mechanosensitive channel